MKNILVLIKGLGRGGAEQLLVNAAPYLDRDRFDYRFAYLIPAKDALVEDLRSRGFDVTCLDGDAGVGWLRRLRALVDERSIDLIHAHLPLPAIGARSAFMRRRNSPTIVYTEHNLWDSYRWSTYWGNKLTFPRNDHVFAVSEHVRASIKSPRGQRTPPIETLYHGPNPDVLQQQSPQQGVRDELGIPRDVSVIGTVANFRLKKGLDYLLQAHQKVRRAVPGTHLVLVGTGPLESELRRRAADLELGDSVVFTGSRPDAPRIASSFDVFTLASVYEGLSIALIEAMASGRPSVVTAVGGLREVVRHGEEALVVPPGDADALANGIVTLLRDAPLRARLGRAARDRVALFDIRKAVVRMEAVYEELLG